MPEIIVPIDMLFEIAKELSRGGKSTAELHQELDKKMKALEKVWGVSAQQRFFTYYRELDLQLAACNEIMNTMAREMQAIAERFAELNRE